jgi:superfamily I DNA/RNA helicase
MEINYDFMADLARDYEYQYQVEELYGKLIAKYLDKQFDIYVSFDERSKYFRCDAIGLNVSMNKLNDYNELFDMIKSKLDNVGDEAKLKNKFHYLFDEISVESKIGEFHDYSRGSFDSMQFFDLLWYLKTDEFIRDGSIGHKLMDVAQAYADKYKDDTATYFYPRTYLQYQIRYGSWIDLSTVDDKFSGWQIKFFQNGKVQMKGLSAEDWDKIVHIDEICSRK